MSSVLFGLFCGKRKNGRSCCLDVAAAEVLVGGCFGVGVVVDGKRVAGFESEAMGSVPDAARRTDRAAIRLLVIPVQEDFLAVVPILLKTPTE